MVVIDIFRILSLQPVLDFSTNSEKVKKNHLYFNSFYRVFTMFLVLVVIMGKWESVDSFNKLMDLFLWLAVIYLTMCALGMVFQVIQCLEISNQPDAVKDPKSPTIEFVTPKKRGRNNLPLVENGEDPLKDDIVNAALNATMEELGENLSSITGGHVLKTLMDDKANYLRKAYKQVSVAEWLYNKYREHFSNFEPKSMTTPSGTDDEELKRVSETMKKHYERLLEEKKREEKENK